MHASWLGVLDLLMPLGHKVAEAMFRFSVEKVLRRLFERAPGDNSSYPAFLGTMMRFARRGPT